MQLQLLSKLSKLLIETTTTAVVVCNAAIAENVENYVTQPNALMKNSKLDLFGKLEALILNSHTNLKDKPTLFRNSGKL